MRLFTRTKTRPETLAAMVQALADAQGDAHRARVLAATYAAKADKATTLLDDLTRAIGTAPMSVSLSEGEVRQAFQEGRGARIKVPTWPPLEEARAAALRFLGRAV